MKTSHNGFGDPKEGVLTGTEREVGFRMFHAIIVGDMAFDPNSFRWHRRADKYCGFNRINAEDAKLALEVAKLKQPTAELYGWWL